MLFLHPKEFFGTLYRIRTKVALLYGNCVWHSRVCIAVVVDISYVASFGVSRHSDGSVGHDPGAPKNRCYL